MTAGGIDGRVIDGRFELLTSLGGGGMGQVWRARDMLLQREVALKEVRSPDTGYGQDSAAAHVMRERVLREAQALARLQHPNVVTIFHIVDSVELAHPWLVMELVAGGSLQGRLQQGPLSVGEAARIGRGVLAALRAAHAAGIQHRDVKPANVLLRLDGTPVLTDFGIAALHETPGLTATGMMVGSPEYMAPERIHGQEGNPASDLWSLGLMLYVCLEGYNPLRRETTIATIAAVADASIPAPQHAGILTPILGALLVRDPAQRPGAEWLNRMFAGVEQALPVSGPTPTAVFVPSQYRDTSEWAKGPVEVSTGTVAGPSKASKLLLRTLPLTLGLAVAGIMYLTWHHDTASTTGSASGAVTSPQQNGRSGSASGAPDSATDSQQPSSADSSSAPAAASASGPTADLLTPAGMRAMIAAVNKVDGGTKVYEMDVYPTYARIEAIKKDNPSVYDNYQFRDGKASFDSTGQTLDFGNNSVDPGKVNWDALPDLLKQADSQLKVKNRTSLYIILDPNGFVSGPELRVYESDVYGAGGYVAADLNGHVTRVEKT